MIIVKIQGGLGNQLFQYALGKHLALINNTKLVLDLSFFSTQTLRSFKLNYFNVQFDDLIEESPNIKRRFNLFNRTVTFDDDTDFFSFNPEILKKRKSDVILNGYWQNQAYFKEIRNQLKLDFQPKSISEQLKTKGEEISQKKGVLIHVRRGDYITNETTTNFHGACSSDYYRNGYKLIQTNKELRNYYIFSDDIPWCQHNLDFIMHKKEYVTSNVSNGDIEDFYLMQQCHNFLISNSTFSWWPAWLSNAPDKIVVSPKNWLANTQHNAQNIIPSNWIKI